MMERMGEKAEPWPTLLLVLKSGEERRNCSRNKR